MGYGLEWCVRRVSGGYLNYLTAAHVGIYIGVVCQKGVRWVLELSDCCTCRDLHMDL